jgi:hypothetical protein
LNSSIPYKDERRPRERCGPSEQAAEKLACVFPSCLFLVCLLSLIDSSRYTHIHTLFVALSYKASKQASQGEYRMASSFRLFSSSLISLNMHVWYSPVLVPGGRHSESHAGKLYGTLRSFYIFLSGELVSHPSTTASIAITIQSPSNQFSISLSFSLLEAHSPVATLSITSVWRDEVGLL